MKVRAFYDPAYEAWRNSKIPEAAARADAAYPEPLEAGEDAKKAWSRRWDAAFLRFMDALVSSSQELN